MTTQTGEMPAGSQFGYTTLPLNDFGFTCDFVIEQGEDHRHLRRGSGLRPVRQGHAVRRLWRKVMRSWLRRFRSPARLTREESPTDDTPLDLSPWGGWIR